MLTYPLCLAMRPTGEEVSFQQLAELMIFRCFSHVNKSQRERVETSMLGAADIELGIVTGQVIYTVSGSYQ